MNGYKMREKCDVKRSIERNKKKKRNSCTEDSPGMLKNVKVESGPKFSPLRIM